MPDRGDTQGLRVLLVVNSLGFGGTERMIERLVLASGLAGRVRFTVCSLEDEGAIGVRLRAAGVEVVALGSRGGTASVVARGVRGLRRLLRARRFDLIHSFLYRSHFATRLARLSLGLRTPLVASERCLGDNRGGLVRLLNRWTGRMSDRVVAVSEAVRARLLSRDGLRPEMVVTIPNGIETPRRSARDRVRLRRVLGIGPGETVILFLGRLHPEKGPDLLLRALARLKDRGRTGWRALMVGDGPARRALQTEAAARGLGTAVVFAGPRHRVDPWIEACDLLVLPSHEEGMPVAPLEAMMRGKAVVATRVGGTPEVVIDEVTGLLVPPADPERLALALERICGDAGLRARLGDAGWRRASGGFSVDAMAAAYLGLYRDLQREAPAADRRAAGALPKMAEK